MTFNNVSICHVRRFKENDDLKFWLNAVLSLSQKNECNPNELNAEEIEEIEEYAKELKILHVKMQEELDQNCKKIQDEYYKTITIKELLSSLNESSQVKEAATPVEKSANAPKSKKVKARARAKKVKAKDEAPTAQAATKKNIPQTTANVSSAKMNSSVEKRTNKFPYQIA